MRQPHIWTVVTILGVTFLFIAALSLSGTWDLPDHRKLFRVPAASNTGTARPYDPTRIYVVESVEDAENVAELHATQNKELMFTTYTFTHKGHYSYEALRMAKHMWENLREVGLLNHSVMITYDLHSCQVLMENGIPCFLDRWLPQPNDLPGQYGSDVPHWYQKYAWALKFIEFGYTAVFMELDAIFFQSPFRYFNPSLDMEGLSDWPVPELKGPKDRFTGPCSVYHMQKGDHNDNYLDWGGNRPDDRNSQYHINPCMSTGFWVVRPRPAAKDFLESFIDLELNWRNWQTDQRLWNEVIMAFLIGHGNQSPLKFSLLNTTMFSNFDVKDMRTERGWPTNTVMLHAGGMPGGAKEPYMREHGYWREEAWDGLTGARNHIEYLDRHYNRTLPSFGRAHLDTI